MGHGHGVYYFRGRLFHVARPNLPTAIIIYWKTEQLGQSVRKPAREDLKISESLPGNITPLGWIQILLNGE